KTCLLLRYHTRKYPEGYIPSMMDCAQSSISVFSKLINLGLWDVPISAWDLDARLRQLFYIDASVFIICFGIDRPDSLTNVAEVWEPDVRGRAKEMNAPIMLVGCKKDVRADPEEQEEMKSYGVTEPVSVEQV
ncbi:hypothetical protein FRC17_007166, partial [Serendipita sp. 399]